MELFKIIKNTTTANRTSSAVEQNKIKELEHILAIEHSSQRLNLDLKNDLFQNDDYLNYFFAIDEKTRILVEKVTANYTKIDIITHQYKSRIASAAFLHHRLMFSIYFKLIVALAPIKHPQLDMLIGRAINNASEIIKWRYFNHQTAPGNVWLQIYNLFDMAEKNGLTNQKIAFYPDLEQAEFMPETIASSFISICMLGSLDNLSFKPQQIDFLSKALSKWSCEISVDNEYNDKKHLFSVDLSKNFPAKRIRNLEESLSNRFWCMDTINIKIQILMNCIETNRPPKQNAMRMLMNNLYAYPTLQTVKSEWSLSEYKRQRRESPRIKTDKPAKNAFGFEDTYYQIKHFEDSLVEITKKSFQEYTVAEDENEIDDSASKAAEKFRKYVESMTTFVNVDHGYCQIVDESAKGICIHVTKQAHELTIGMMLGVSVKDQKFGTKIGIIRSIKPTLNNTLRVGVEIISRHAFCIEATNLSQAKNAVNGYTVEFIEENIETFDLESHDLNTNDGVFNCLFLPKQLSFGKEESLILPKNQYQKHDQYTVNIADKVRTISLTETLEQHENWIRVNFRDIEVM
jgi:hypothetical protein